MHRALLSIAALTMSLAVACKGCEDGPKQKPAATIQASGPSVQGDEAKRKARLEGRKLDRDKVYPKNADGSVACGTDVNCFVLQAEGCTKAELSGILRSGAFGIDQAIFADYRITGGDSDHCKMTRHITQISVTLNPKLEEAMRKQGKTDADVAKMKLDGEASLHRQNPALLSCEFEQDEALSVALDIAEARPDPRPWRKSCKEELGADRPAAPAAGDEAAPGKAANNH